MMKRGASIAGSALLALACGGHPEKAVIDQYFNASNAKDTQTLTSFAAVNFDQKVDRWVIRNTGEERESDMPLPALIQKVKDIEAELAANTRAARAYNNDRYMDLDALKALPKGAAVPAKLQPVKAEWDKFNEKDRELKKALANAKDAVEKEKRTMMRSVGQVDDIEALTGKLKEKTLDVDLTIGGEVKPHTMQVRRYDVKREGGGARVVSRWMIQDIKPKG